MADLSFDNHSTSHAWMVFTLPNIYRRNDVIQSLTYQVLMRIVFVVEDGNDFTELRQNVVVPRHVSRQYASDNTLTYFPVGGDDKLDGY